ncbi:protein tesmin/TSO1-like CXC 2 [Punica granatum]|uniref:Protein tesmin/TSO1-like CXC 2 n=1 Tax=Punica granatum TaxID=22663 RepID=A0A6P8CJ60_PUNGR|nr:protein tesmin/TSO1-like CXC 2 [Punica granatum]
MEMDTPERTQIASSSTPISKFEDSPVFNYINNLSPIKPVKSTHITQTFSSLTFASLPSIFTSPHVSSHKESRFLRRHQSLDSSKLKSPGNAEKASTNEGAEAELRENFDAGISIASASAEQLSEHTEFAIELPRTLKYDCGSPDCGPTEEAGIQGADSINQLEGEADPGNKQTDPGCDWESLVSETADLLIFSSPNDAEAFRGIFHKSPGLGTGIGASLSSTLLQSNMTDVQKMQLLFQIAPGEHPEMGDALENIEMKHTQEDLGSDDLESMGIYPSDGCENEAAPHGPFADTKPVSNLHRGMRRRCLDFEMAGAHPHRSLPDSSSYSSSLSHSKDKMASKNLQLASVNNKRGGESSRHVLPGIGLHLNSLASAKDYKAIKRDTLSSETQVSNIHGQELLPQPMNSTASDKEADESGNIPTEDTSKALVLLSPEELNPSSPRKKRRRVEHSGEAEACKRCNCKKSKCLKLYCECFAAGVYCIEPCACQDCFNKPIHEDTVLATRKQIESRNPLAFAPKVIRGSDSITELGDDTMKTPASARHKRGCNCKKSSCLKKYCECYQGGVGCSINCRCEGCKNAFGTKDGSVLGGAECEPEEEETEKFEKTGLDVIPLKTEHPRSEEQIPSAVLPSTPSGLSRPPVQMAFPPSKGKPPRSSFLTTIGSSYILNAAQKMGKTEFLLPPPPKFEKPPPQPNTEDEMPEILRGSTTPTASIKTASPNRKRVSPPHGEFGSSPSLRSGRRLILQSIPSFPSLTSQH